MNRPLAPLAAMALAAMGPAAIVMAGFMAAPAHAGDDRLVERPYAPDEVVVIEGKTQVQATIQFGKDERIENVAIGDSTSWQVTPNKRANLLFVKPLSTKAVTNMTVVTDKHTYLFDLIANPKARPLYVLRFLYPQEAEPDEAVSLAQAPNTVEMQAANDPYAVTDPAQLNFAWKGEGDTKLLPSKTYDDGQATFLSWPPATPVPAILIKDYEGTEGPVNYAVRGDTIVVDGVPREIILRSGKDSAKLTNEGPVRRVANPGDTELARAGETG